MKNFLSSSILFPQEYAQRTALLLGLSGLTAGASGQSFGPVSAYSAGAGSNPQCVALGDVNGDGRPDIVTANDGSNTVGVLLGQAVGGFAAAVTYSAGVNSRPRSVVLTDIDEDGRLDILTANSGSGTLGVLRGTGGGVFGPVGTSTLGAPSRRPFRLLLQDVSRDGRPDLVVVFTGTYEVAVLMGQFGGNFGGGFVTPVSSSYISDVAVGDVNADGWPDIVTTVFDSGVAGSSSVQAWIVKGGTNTIASSARYSPGGNEPRGMAMADVNGDGRPDIVTANAASHTVGVLLGQAGGGFATTVIYSTGANTFPNSVALGDVNGDGRPDIVTANLFSNTVGVLLGQVAGSFASVVTYSTGPGSSPQWVVLRDVNGDRRPDLVTANTNTASVGVLLNTGTFTPLATAPALSAADVSLSPNPAHEAFTVQLPAGFSPSNAALLNALGQVVRRPAVGAASFRVETGGLAPGVYTLRLQAGGVALAKRVVVQ